jgi:hypothetical protein
MPQLAVSFCISDSTCAFAGGVGSTMLLGGGGPTWINKVFEITESPWASHARA